ncbi:hypothetical protein M9458_051695 [Cirrhinus mrigala]|uniref:Uncharacterized protein n=1 Tax=Cirrhinus mrigala TaxID=683832 RepID=A0ABD0MWN3_CIRMR
MVKVSGPEAVMMVFRPWTVSGKLRGEDYCRVSSNWTNETNATYCTAVAELVEAIRVTFPARVDTSRIGNCCQTREESVQGYYHQLYKTFNKHSSLDEPDDKRKKLGTWECHLRVSEWTETRNCASSEGELHRMEEWTTDRYFSACSAR